MSVYHQDNLLKTYKIALGFSPSGAKEKEGDGKTPEGIYFISHKNNKSRFHLSLKISYPNEKDLKNAKQKNFSAGDNIMIHGLSPSTNWIGELYTQKDWTLGCIAVTNPEIEEIFSATSVGTKVEIRP